MSCEYCGKTNSNDGHGSCMFCGGPLKRGGYRVSKRVVGPVYGGGMTCCSSFTTPDALDGVAGWEHDEEYRSE